MSTAGQSSTIEEETREFASPQRTVSRAVCRIERFHVPRLGGDVDPDNLSPIARRQWPLNRAFRGHDETIVTAEIRSPYEDRPKAVLERESVLKEFVRAGPREKIVVDPTTVKAAIVTCGGLCPGLNTVIRELVMCLHYNYGVDTIYGVEGGYRGFKKPLKELTPGDVVDSHLSGGTILGSSRGGFDLDAILDSIRSHGLHQLYIIGGDGTHRGAREIMRGVEAAGLAVAVAVVPKTIDNDIPLVGKSFGFDTAISEAQRAIMSARVEACAAPNGIGLVKLMGRNSGFIALQATLASQHVALCLIPEMPLDVDSMLAYLIERVEKRGHAVVVVAEGVQPDGLVCEEKDASGNTLLADVGAHLKARIKSAFKARDMECNIKLVDPTYMIRSVPANATDSIYCGRLARNAVDGAFAGFTGFTCGVADGYGVLIPVQEVTARTSVRVDPAGPAFARMCLVTGQPMLCTDMAC